MSRMGDLEMSMKFHASGAQEMHGALSALRVEVEQLVLSTTPAAPQQSSQARAPPPAFDPSAGQKMGQAAQTFNIHSPQRQQGHDGFPKSKWKLYDEMFIMPPSQQRGSAAIDGPKERIVRQTAGSASVDGTSPPSHWK